MKKYMLVFIFFSLLFLQVRGQAKNPVNLLPPSPDAASLGKYGTYPVTLSSGLINIDIPIYTIDLPLIKIPISISYHPSGIKVDEIASSVGLGWALNAGGVISREVKGQPDYTLSPPPSLYYRNADEVYRVQENGVKGGILQKAYENELNSTYDNETDVYSYNFGGLTGSFRFDTDGNIIQTPLSNSKIENLPSSGRFGYFRITAADGTIYTFRDSEEGMQALSQDRHTTSWYISSIETIDGQVISFEYGVDTTPYTDYYLNTSINVANEQPVSSYLDLRLNATESYSYMDKTLYLKSIQYSGGKVVFTNTLDRQDRRKSRLSGIEIYNNKQKLIKSFALEHSYFEKSSCKRLKLDKVIIQDGVKARLGSYEFGYNTKQLLPPYYKALQTDKFAANRDYFGQDYCGYYNGVTTNKCLLFAPATGYEPQLLTVDRSVKSEFAQACVLNKVTYPTGGYTEFEYESNQLTSEKLLGGLRIKTVKSFKNADSSPNVRSYEYISGNENSPYSLSAANDYTQILIRLCTGPSGIYICEAPSYNVYSTARSLIPGAPVYYTKAIEYMGYPNNCSGKTDFYFNTGETDIQAYNSYKITPLFYAGPTFKSYFTHYIDSRGWTRGSLIQQDVFSFENNLFVLKKSIKNTYTNISGKEFRVGFKAFRNIGQITGQGGPGDYPLPPNTHFQNYDQEYQYTNILSKTGILKLTKTEETAYIGSKAVTKTVDSFYDNASVGFYEVTRTEEKSSNGDITKKTFKYPTTLGGSTHQKMLDRNIRNVVVEEIINVNDKHVESISYNYTIINESIFNPWYTDIKSKNGAYEREYTYLYDKNYNNGKTILEIQTKDGVSTTYIWGYNSTLPVAKISNVAYKSIYENTALMAYLNKLQEYSDLSDINTCNNLQTLNNTIRQNIPTNSLIETYTYSPLLGITSKSDASGISTYYGYDSFGHLKEIFRIESGTKKILKVYDYHYYEK